jgi:hypothetical protein
LRRATAAGGPSPRITVTRALPTDSPRPDVL